MKQVLGINTPGMFLVCVALRHVARMQHVGKSRSCTCAWCVVCTASACREAAAWFGCERDTFTGVPELRPPPAG